MASFKEYPKYDGLGLAELISCGDVSPEEVTEAALERIEALNPTVNAICHHDFERALERSKMADFSGPFAGVPFLVKDIVAKVNGMPCTWGTKVFASHVADFDSELVIRFKKAGLNILGITTSPEMGLMPTTESTSYGPTRNPFNLKHSVGGSSGGSGAAIASLMVPLAHGNDGGGSIRIPASCCGLVGLKPTRGMTPTGPDGGRFFQGMAIDGGLSRTVRDSAALLDAIQGPDMGSPLVAIPHKQSMIDMIAASPSRLKIAFNKDGFFKTKRIDPECITAVDKTAKLLTELNHDVVEAKPEFDLEAVTDAYIIIMVCEFAHLIATLTEGEKKRVKHLEPYTQLVNAVGRHYFKGHEYAWACSVIDQCGRDCERFLHRYDMLLSPVLATPPPPIGALLPSSSQEVIMKVLATMPFKMLMKQLYFTMRDALFDYVAFTPLANITGQPSISVPLHMTKDGLPVGSLFTGRMGSDGKLLQLAKQLEDAAPWIDRFPAM